MKSMRSNQARFVDKAEGEVTSSRYESKYWNEKEVVVTGGASFIGSHLVDELVRLGSRVTIIDDLSSGSLQNLAESLDKVRFLRHDLEFSSRKQLTEMFKGSQVVFHLAATHGGRGYIDAHPADVCSNLAIDHHVFEACRLVDVERVVFASSACVYPPSLQSSERSDYLLKEEDSDLTTLDGFLSADVEYGWAKLMGEMQLNAFRKQYGLKGRSVRFVTAYGERENETHAIVALIYKAFERMDPYVIWGTGDQDRDFTYVADIVRGTLLAGELIGKGEPINLGTGTRHKMKDVAKCILNLAGFTPSRLVFDSTRPIGVSSRALDISRAKMLLGWQPEYSLEMGLERTIDWYFATNTYSGRVSDKLLMER